MMNKRLIYSLLVCTLFTISSYGQNIKPDFFKVRDYSTRWQINGPVFGVLFPVSSKLSGNNITDNLLGIDRPASHMQMISVSHFPGRGRFGIDFSYQSLVFLKMRAKDAGYERQLEQEYGGGHYLIYPRSSAGYVSGGEYFTPVDGDVDLMTLGAIYRLESGRFVLNAKVGAGIAIYGRKDGALILK